MERVILIKQARHALQYRQVAMPLHSTVIPSIYLSLSLVLPLTGQSDAGSDGQRGRFLYRVSHIRPRLGVS